MLRHSSPRQVRKNRRDLNLRKRIEQWSAIIAKHGEAGIAYAVKHGIDVKGDLLASAHLPGVPLDYPAGLYDTAEVTK